jgi:tRNA pseudouridine(38-40) synthase
MPFYKMTVAYDGSRFNGFQRQITNDEMESRAPRCLASSNSCNDDGTTNGEEARGSAPADSHNTRKKEPIGRSRPYVPKRPHWDSHSGKKKRVACTVQDCLEDAIASWTGGSAGDVALRFAGRTDAGVHARGQVIRVRLTPPLRRDDASRRRQRLGPTEGDGPTQTEKGAKQSDGDERCREPFEIQNAINSRLPVDISVAGVQEVPTNERGEPLFDPRRHVSRKQYSYTLKFRRKAWSSSSLSLSSSSLPSEAGKPGEREDDRLLPICRAGPNSFRHAFDSPCCWVVPWPLDDSPMSALCRFLEGRHNFAAFVHKDARRAGPSSSGGGNDPDDANGAGDSGHVMTLDAMRYEILSESPEDAPAVTARLVFESKGFRRTMVRNLVGFCVDVCRGLPEVAAHNGFAWDEVWSESAASKIHAAPACGLCLEWVRY